MTTTRETLKAYFSKGAIPKATEFAELIDQVLIQNDDKLFQTADGPLGIKAATEGTLLNFYDKDNQLTWQLKQQEDKATGLSLRSGEQSRLFIDSATGNIGVGTTETGKVKLTVAGGTRLNGSVAVTGATTLNGALTVKGATTTTTLEGPLTVAGLLTANQGAAISGGATVDSLTVSAGNISFTNKTQQMLNLWSTQYGIGIQNSTQYFRTNANFAWYKGGGHDDGVLSPGSAGIVQMVIKDGNVGIGTADPGAYKLNVAGNTNVTGNLKVTGTGTIITQSPWTDVSQLSNSWNNYPGGEYSKAGYFKDSLGIVHLRGLVTGGTFDWDGSKYKDEAVLFTLPSGFKPLTRELHVVSTYGATGAARVDILMDGTVRPMFGRTEWISLFGISFRAA